MFGNFSSYISSLASFTPEELEQICLAAIEKKIRRKQLPLREGEICRYKMFVSKGLLRTYQVKADGTEYIMRFAAENCWSSDHESFNHQTPSEYNIEALEDSEILMWTREAYEHLLATIPAFKSAVEKVMAIVIDASHRRIRMHISCTAEEKYQDFVDSFPEVVERVPLHMIASYLGVSRETLSRIRRAQWNRASSTPSL